MRPAPSETLTSTESEKTESQPEAAQAAQPRQGIWHAAGQVLDSYMERDPAATSRMEVALTSTGLHALLWHRMCHRLWKWGLCLVARMVANIGRWLFGVEIHPAVRIGRRLFIDHGSGIVIGATTEIGDDVSIYQGVTLGGVTQVDKGKRHPTLEDGVVVGAGAMVLGPITVGAGAKVGSNAVVVKDVPPGATMVGVPAHEASGEHKQGFTAYGVDGCGVDDFERLVAEVRELRAEVERLQGKDGD